ncbi:MAG: hypothetical protein WC640_02365 [Candidatus Paceibacterota bacterium]|jgi:hypothetical protein
MSLRVKIGAGLMALLPMTSFALGFNNAYFTNMSVAFKTIIGNLLPAFIGLAIIGFAYGLFVYLKGGAEDKEKGKTLMIWGGLAVVILISIYGIAGLLQDLTGATDTNITPPTTIKGLNI